MTPIPKPLPCQTVQIGTRVRLKPRHDWICWCMAMANSKRVGTIIALPCKVEFDVVKIGSRPKIGDFNPEDLEIVAETKPSKYEDHFMTAPTKPDAERLLRKPDLEDITWNIDEIYKSDLEEGRKRVRLFKLLTETFELRIQGFNHDDIQKMGKAIHYPEHWDTINYPTLWDAIHEVVTNTKCSECCPAPDAANVGVDVREHLEEIIRAEETEHYWDGRFNKRSQWQHATKALSLLSADAIKPAEGGER